MTLIYLTLAWVAGIALTYHTEIEPVLPITLMLLTVPGLIYFRKENPIILGMVLFAALGMLRFEAARPTADDQHVIHLNDQGILTLEGLVIAEPKTRDTHLQILVDAQTAAGKTVHGHVLAYVPRFTEIEYGDKVQLFGQLVTPPEFDTFSYRDYLVRQGVFSLMPSAKVEIRAHHQGNPFYQKLFEIKADAREFILDTLPEPQASLLVGILLGDETGLSEDTEAAFSRTGASHVIAISGFNMAIIAGFISLALKNIFPEKSGWVVGLSLLTIGIYTIFVGASAAVVRAAIMSSLLIMAQGMQRRTYVITSLAFATLMMSALNPWVLWEIGFQLSLAAVIGMALFVKPIERYTRQGLEKLVSQNTGRKLLNLFSESLIVTVAAQITTTPIILFYFGRLSLVSLPVNFLIIPVQTPLLVSGGIAVLFGLFVPILGKALLQITWIFLTWTVEVVEGFAGFSLADTALSINQTVIMLFFIGLTLYILYRATRPRWAMRWMATLQQKSTLPLRAVQFGLFTAFILLINAAWSQPDGKLHVTFFDVGESNAILIETPQGANILMDGGRFPSRLLDGLGESLPAQTRHLDILVITSPDTDNIAALSEVVDRYTIGAVITNGQDDLNPIYTSLIAQIEREGIPIIAATTGYQLISDDGLELAILAPDQIPAEGDQNTSLVLRLTYQEAVFLFTNNIHAEVEALLLQNPHVVQTTVLQVADHGSGDASTLPFITVAEPQVAILQLDVDPPSPTVIDRLANTHIFRTDQHGKIEIVTDGHELQISTEHP